MRNQPQILTYEDIKKRLLCFQLFLKSFLELRANEKSGAHLCDLITFSNVKQRKSLRVEKILGNGKCFHAAFSIFKRKSQAQKEVCKHGSMALIFTFPCGKDYSNLQYPIRSLDNTLQLPVLRQQHVTLRRSDFLKEEKAKKNQKPKQNPTQQTHQKLLLYSKKYPWPCPPENNMKIIARQQKCPSTSLKYKKCRN